MTRNLYKTWYPCEHCNLDENNIMNRRQIIHFWWIRRGVLKNVWGWIRGMVSVKVGKQFLNVNILIFATMDKNWGGRGG